MTPEGYRSKLKCNTKKLLMTNSTITMYWNRQIFLKQNTMSNCHKTKNDKLGYIKIKNLCSFIDNIERLKSQSTKGKKIFIIHTSDKY